MKRQAVIYGSRPDGHAKVVLETLALATDWQCVGFIDDVPENRDRAWGGLKVLGDRSTLTVLRDQGVAAIFFGFGAGAARRQLLAVAQAAGLEAPALVHPRAFVAASACLAPGVQVMAGAVVQAGARLGAAVLVNSGAVVEHDADLASGVNVGPGAVLAGRVRAGEDADIGAGVTIVPDIVVGARSLVGAGAVVIRPVPDGTRVAGVPAKPLPGPGA